MTQLAVPVVFFWVVAVLALASLIGWGLARAGFPIAAGHRRFAEIDGVRGYLALMVMVQHFLIWAHGPPGTPVWTPPPQPFAHELGTGSVAVFFMITGFLFAPRIDQGLFGSNWAEFVVARFFRLAPLVLTSALLVAVLIHAETGARPVLTDAKTALMWIFGRQEQHPLSGMADPGLWDAHVLWSLRWEWFFYLGIMPAWAAVIALWPRARHARLLPVIILALCLAARAIFAAHGRPAPDLAMFLPFFVAGYAVCALARQDLVKRMLGGRAGDVLAVSALVGGMAIWPEPFGWGQVFFALFFLCVACGAGLGGILRQSGALVLGECSYAIYLLHGTALAALFRWAPGLVHAMPLQLAPALMLAVTAVVVPVAAAAHLAVERPMMRRGKTWGKALRSLLDRSPFVMKIKRILPHAK
jgi:peptidoglycan/LPS O-acetylase OafA/YrhL